MASSKLSFNENTPIETYEELFDSPVGTVFHADDYETVLRRITEDYKPKNKVFEVFPITPGTDLFTMYGPNHLVVTENRSVTA